MEVGKNWGQLSVFFTAFFKPIYDSHYFGNQARVGEPIGTAYFLSYFGAVPLNILEEHFEHLPIGIVFEAECDVFNSWTDSLADGGDPFCEGDQAFEVNLKLR
jgi:hypothetical protein